MIDLAWIQKVIDMVEGAEIDSLEISRWGTRVRVAKSPTVHIASGAPATAAVSAGQQPAQALSGPAGAPGVAEPAGAAPEAADDLVDIVSPMVGTFYRAPAPDAPVYVDAGDKVSKGQTLCILEAMKLMNELEAEVAGTIREICVENGDPVEYGQLLFRIDPA
ncbi:MAG: acetyl-CoA carboxylase biotin carboxyl carrier protein [Gemmatimonadota bacterium]